MIIGWKFPVIDYIKRDIYHFIDHDAKISEFITPSRQWHLSVLEDILLKDIIDKTKAIPILVIDDKLPWKFIINGEFSVKTATWANKGHMFTPKSKTFNFIWSLNLFVLSFFAWKLIRMKLLITGRLRKFWPNIDVGCPFWHQVEEDIDYILKQCQVNKMLWATIEPIVLHLIILIFLL